MSCSLRCRAPGARAPRTMRLWARPPLVLTTPAACTARGKGSPCTAVSSGACPQPWLDRAQGRPAAVTDDVLAIARVRREWGGSVTAIATAPAYRPVHAVPGAGPGAWSGRIVRGRGCAGGGGCQPVPLSTDAERCCISRPVRVSGRVTHYRWLRGQRSPGRGRAGRCSGLSGGRFPCGHLSGERREEIPGRVGCCSGLGLGAGEVATAATTAGRGWPWPPA